MAYEQEDHPKLQFPIDSNSYNITAEIGAGSNADFRNLVGRETNTSSLLSHPNILNPHCSFTAGNRLWVVMPLMSGGSLESIISSSSPNGIKEQCIAIIIKETLTALSYLHSRGHLHRDIKASNILLDDNGRMAPEVIHSHKDYSFKADIWSFDITALVSTKKLSETFHDMVASCLDKDPVNQPSAGELLRHPFFESCNGTSEFLAENLLRGLPSVEERFRAASKILEEGVGCDTNGDWASGLLRNDLMSSIIGGNNKEYEEFEVHYHVFPVESTQAVIPCDDDGKGQQPAAGGRGNEVNAETMVNKLMALIMSLDDQKEKNLKLIQAINEEEQLLHRNARMRFEFECQREQNLELIQVINEKEQLLHQNERLRLELENEKLIWELEK
ncbi:hypothetical protein GOBAR_DD19981 [Gossypium barbadense]|nr:hypothetical protein GOBAR_DD19981 [Gossypium barbadense]